MLNGSLILNHRHAEQIKIASYIISLSVFNLKKVTPRAYTSCVIPLMSRCEQMQLDDANTSYQCSSI